MKIRNGFVSNSSSSSFCIYGACMNSDEVKEKFECSDLWELENKLGDKGLDVCWMSDGYHVYVGRQWKDIGDEETGKAFKEDVEKGVKEFFGNQECRTHEEAWYDG